MKSIGWVGLGLVSALGAAGVAIFGSLGLEKIDSTLATTLRAVIMAAMLVVLTLITGQLQGLFNGEATVTGRAWLFIVLAGFSGALSWLAYFGALKLGLAGSVAAVDRLSVAFVFILGILFLGERHGWQGWLGLLLLVGGVYLIASEG